MFGFVRALFFGALALVLLVPAAVLLAAIGLPVIAVLGVLALPVLLVLFLVGLPFIVLFAVVVGLLGAVFGVLVAFLALGAVALKVALVVLIPLLVIGWVLKRVLGVGDPYRIRA